MINREVRSRIAQETLSLMEAGGYQNALGKYVDIAGALEQAKAGTVHYKGEALRQLVAERDMALAVVTHDMGVIAALADDVVVMREGRIVEQGPVARVIAAPEHEYTRSLLAATPRVPSFSAAVRANSMISRPPITTPAALARPASSSATASRQPS